MPLYVNEKMFTPCYTTIIGEKVICLNNTGANITEGEKVFITSKTNSTLVSWENATSQCFTGIAIEDITNGSSGNVLVIFTK